MNKKIIIGIVAMLMLSIITYAGVSISNRNQDITISKEDKTYLESKDFNLSFQKSDLVCNGDRCSQRMWTIKENSTYNLGSISVAEKKCTSWIGEDEIKECNSWYWYSEEELSTMATEQRKAQYEKIIAVMKEREARTQNVKVAGGTDNIKG